MTLIRLASKSVSVLNKICSPRLLPLPDFTFNLYNLDYNLWKKPAFKIPRFSLNPHSRFKIPSVRVGNGWILKPGFQNGMGGVTASRGNKEIFAGGNPFKFGGGPKIGAGIRIRFKRMLFL